MICRECNRDDVIYPIIDRFTDRMSCPYCGALESIVPGEGETRDTLAERESFARERGWIFKMQTTFKIHEQELDGTIHDSVPILFAEHEGSEWQIVFVFKSELESIVEHYRNTGVLRIPQPLTLWGAYKEREVSAVLVCATQQSLRKLPGIEQVEDDLPKSEQGQT